MDASLRQSLPWQMVRSQPTRTMQSKGAVDRYESGMRKNVLLGLQENSGKALVSTPERIKDPIHLQIALLLRHAKHYSFSVPSPGGFLVKGERQYEYTYMVHFTYRLNVKALPGTGLKMLISWSAILYANCGEKKKSADLCLAHGRNRTGIAIPR